MDSSSEGQERGGTSALKDPKRTAAEHLEMLREYARKAVVHDEKLTEEEEADRVDRMQEFQAIGTSFKLTGREMVVVLYKGLLTGKRSCGCPSCKQK